MKKLFFKWVDIYENFLLTCNLASLTTKLLFVLRNTVNNHILLIADQDMIHLFTRLDRFVCNRCGASNSFLHLFQIPIQRKCFSESWKKNLIQWRGSFFSTNSKKGSALLKRGSSVWISGSICGHRLEINISSDKWIWFPRESWRCQRNNHFQAWTHEKPWLSLRSLW